MEVDGPWQWVTGAVLCGTEDSVAGAETFLNLPAQPSLQHRSQGHGLQNSQHWGHLNPDHSVWQIMRRDA